MPRVLFDGMVVYKKVLIFWRFADVFRFQRMPVTCAPFFLTRFAGIVLTPRNLRLMKVRAMMESERLLSSSPSISTPNKSKKLKQSVDVAVEKGLVKSEALEIQMIRDDPSRLESMTLQQLRTTSRNLGIPAKGSKHDLLLTVKCFLENEKDEVRRDPECTESRRKARNLSGGDNSLNTSLATEISGSQQKKRRGKLPSNDNTIADINEGTVTMKEELRNTTDGITETAVLQHKKSGGESLSVDGTNVKVRTRAVTSTKKQGPYVKTDEVPDTKRSRAQKKGLSGDDNGNDGSSGGGLGPSTDLSEPWTMLAHKKPQPGWIPYNPRTMRPPPLADGTEFVKLLSWNVNGLRALLKLEGFSALQLAQRENFDVLCLQETKLQEKDVEEIKRCLIDGYDNSFWTCSVSKLGYSGTAIISRIKPLSVRYGLGILDHDSEGRLVTVEFDTFYLICGYVPNSGDGLKRLTYRIAEWDMSLSNYMKELEKSKPVILTGDLNCAHQEIDIYNPAGNRRSAGFTIEERQSFETNFLSRGFVDTFRRQHPGVLGYTYWGYRHGGRVGNKGWRLDYFLVSESIADKVHDSYILPDVLGSDHCPIGLILKL